MVADLRLNYATGVAQGIYHIQNLTGSNGNSLLVGDAQNNVITGGTKRNILIGDGGADSLTSSGGGDNILIGDITLWDANLGALMAIMLEWTRLDLSFEQRLAHLIGNGSQGFNGNLTLNNKTVFSDNAVDTLTGSSTVLNWYFITKRQDVYASKIPRDHVTEV